MVHLFQLWELDTPLEIVPLGRGIWKAAVWLKHGVRNGIFRYIQELHQYQRKYFEIKKRCKNVDYDRGTIGEQIKEVL